MTKVWDLLDSPAFIDSPVFRYSLPTKVSDIQNHLCVSASANSAGRFIVILLCVTADVCLSVCLLTNLNNISKGTCKQKQATFWLQFSLTQRRNGYILNKDAMMFCFVRFVWGVAQ